MLPELEEKVATTSNIESPMINETETEQQKSEDMQNAAGSTEVTVKPPLYVLTCEFSLHTFDCPA